MATKTPAASAPSDDVRAATFAGRAERDGVQYPSLRMEGEAPRKGSTLRVRLANGVTYSAKVHAVTEDGIIETEGLTPEASTP